MHPMTEMCGLIPVYAPITQQEQPKTTWKRFIGEITISGMSCWLSQ